MKFLWNICHYYFFPNDREIPIEDFSIPDIAILNDNPDIVKFSQQVINDNALVTDIYVVQCYVNELTYEITIQLEIIIDTREYQRLTLLNSPKLIQVSSIYGIPLMIPLDIMHRIDIRDSSDTY